MNRPSTAPNPNVMRVSNANRQSRRNVKSSHSSIRRGKANFLKKANVLKKDSRKKQQTNVGFQRTKFNFIRDPITKFPSRISSDQSLSNNNNNKKKSKHHVVTKFNSQQKTQEEEKDSNNNTMDETGLPTGNNRLSAMEDVSAALRLIDNWTTQSKEEESGFKSFSLFARVHLAETLKSTRSYGIPNIPRSACCIELLLKMGQLFGRYSDLHEVL